MTLQSWGPEPPPRNPAREARLLQAAMRRELVANHVRMQGRAAVDGLIECVRIGGVVLVVLQLVDLVDGWLAWGLTLMFAPQLVGMGLLAWLLARRLYIDWRVQREVR